MLIPSEKKTRTMRNFMRAAAAAGCATFFLFAFGCAEAPKDTRAADETTIRALDAQWAKSAAAKDVDATVGYYADDASLLAPNAPIASDKASIRAAWSALLGPDTSLNWQASKVEVARSSDLAYVQGVYQFSTKDAHGKPEMDRGKFVEVWKKQADGNWKVVEDIFNTDLPAQKAEPVAARKARHAHSGKKHHGHSRSNAA
jgi:ketosteroid isomerase-like protein